MSKINKFQNGFGLVIVVLAITAIGIIGYVGWKIYEFNKPEAPASDTTTQNDAINKAEDLDAANDELNSQKIDTGLDTSDIDASLSN